MVPSLQQFMDGRGVENKANGYQSLDKNLSLLCVSIDRRLGTRTKQRVFNYRGWKMA